MNAIASIEEKSASMIASAKNKVDEFVNREDVSEKIEKAKDSTIDFSLKAVDKLKEVLNRGDK